MFIYCKVQKCNMGFEKIRKVVNKVLRFYTIKNQNFYIVLFKKIMHLIIKN